MFIRIAVSLALLAGGAAAQVGPASAYWDAQKSSAVHDLVSAFNQIASHAGRMRVAMSQPDADAFDAVMLDMMGALASFPGISWKDKPTSAAIRPVEARPGRVSQLKPEVEAMVRFFERLQKSSSDTAGRKLFADAQRSARKMAAALPNVLPTVAGLPVRLP